MKKKTFILTLMMLLSTFVFGQEYYFPEVINNGEYPEPMPITAVISFDGIEQQSDKLELGIFCGDEIRGRVFTKKRESNNRYYARISVFGKRNDYFTFKVYDHNAGKEWNYGCTITIGDSELEYLSYDTDGYGSYGNPCVINFTAPNHWTPNEYGYNSSLFMQAVIKINGEELSNPNLELGAFCNGECRGSVKTDFTYEYNGVKRYYARINIYGNSGDVITFRLYDHSSGEELEYIDVNTIDYEANASIGTIISPFVVNFITSPYVAQIGETKYQTFDAALEAAQDGDDIVLLENISLTETAVLSKDINISLNNNTVAGTIELANTGATVTGAQDAVTSVITNIADHKVVYEGGMYKVVAKVYVAQVGTTKYETLEEAYNAATAENGIVLLSNITLQSTWKIEKPINISLGSYTVAGTIELANTGATITGAQNAVTSVITNITDYKVVYEGGMYKVVAKVYVAQVGTTKYETLEEAYNAATAENGIVLLSNITLQSTWKIEKPINISLGSYTVAGTIELANTGATITGAQNAVTSVITNITDYKVVYENGMYKVVAKVYVAQVGTTKYETLEEAIAAAQAEQTITVLKDINLSETLIIAAEKNFTLDLNGKNITATNANANLDIYGNLTIEDKIGGGVSTFRNHKVSNGGSLTLTSGTLQNISTNTGGYGIYVTEGGSATINGGIVKAVNNSNYAICVKGNLTVNAGTIVGNHGVIAVENANAVANINNGEYILKGVSGSSDHLIYIPAGKINIAGGNFTCENLLAEGDSMVYTENGIIAVSGGKFGSPIEEAWCAEGYIPTQFTDGTYGVKLGSYIAQIGATKYETFEAAYAAANAGQTIELFRTVVLTSDSDYNKEVTVKAEFDDVAFRVKASVSFNNMTIISDDYCVIVGAEDGAGKLTINGGAYKGETTAVSVTQGELNIMDGTFEVEPYQGSYEYTINCIDANYNQTAKVAIQGGKFYKFNPMNNAAEGVGTNFCAEGYEARYNQNDEIYYVRRKPAGYVSNRAKVTDKDNREAITVILKEVYALESLVVKVYNDETLMFTSTRREQDLDDEQKMLFPVDGNTSVNIVLWGQIAGSWINEIHVAPTELNVPNKIEVYADGTLVDTYTHQSGTVLGDYLDEYLALDCVKKAVAKIGETKYMTLAEAIAAAQSGQTIVVLADVETTNVALPTDVTLDLNGKTVKADIIGKISINNGLWVTKEDYKMIGDGAEYYQTTDATIVMGTNYSLEMLSGTVNLVPAQWYTLQGQNITIKQGATFNISAGQTFVINGSTVENNGTVNNAGTIQILAGTVKGNITGNLHFKGGNYITADNHKMVGTTSDYHYNATDALVNIATNGDITIAAGAMTLGHDWRTLPGQTVTVAQGATFTVPTGMTYQIYGTAIVNGTITVNGTVELAALEATLKAQEGLNVITNIEDKAVAYENGTYKVVQAIYEQRRTLGAGWNWFSSYINISGEEGLQALETALDTSGLQIKGQLGFVDYSSGWGWNGTLVSASVEEMYMIQTSAQVELVLTGELANPATPITLQKNWTYIGYPVSEPMNLEDALANITPNDGDIIKTHNGGVAQYNAAYTTWYTQSLQSMTPGMGYMYRNTSGTTKTLVYPTPNANSRAAVKANVTSEDNHWAPNASAFANNMNIIAVLESNDMMGEFEVAAFVNGEVRGSARPTYVEPIDAYVLFMTIYGEEGEEMTFKYYDIYSDEEHSINNTVNYSDNAVIGSIREPYMFFANTLGMDEKVANTLSIYPNPTTTNTAISFETTFDMVEVFNSLGAKVAEYRNVDRIEGMEAAGVYVIRVTNDSAVQNCRLIVK